MNKLIEALQHGQKLANSESWKKTQTVFNTITSLATMVLPLIPQVTSITPDTIVQYSAIYYTLVGAYNAYTTTATSDTVGFNRANAL